MSLTQADLDAAKNDILAKVNDRFAALGKLVNPAPPPPPPVVTPQIKFASHRYWLSGPKQAADVYDFQDGPGWVRTDFPAAAQTFRYATTARSVGDTLASRQLVPTGVSSAYLAKRPDGNIVSRAANGDQLLDISSAGLLNAVQSWLPSITSKFDGLYLDEVDETWHYGYPTATTTVQWLNDTAWQNSMVTFVQGISQALHSHGKKLWINLGSSLGASHPFIAGVVGAADAVNLEYFVGREKVSLAPATGSDLYLLLNRVQWVEKTLGKQAHAHVSTSSQTVVDQAFAAWLLATEFLGSFTASLDYGGDYMIPSATLLAQARKLGAPLGVMNVGAESGTVTRAFTNGRVTLNTYSLAYTVSVP